MTKKSDLNIALLAPGVIIIFFSGFTLKFSLLERE